MVKTRWLMLPILISLVILPRLSIDLYLPSLPHIGSALQASDGWVQVTLTAFMFGYGISLLVAGVLCDIVGVKKVIMLGLTLFIVATFVCASSTTIMQLIIARFFQALGGGCCTLLARIMVKETYERGTQLKVLANLSAAMAICALITPVFGGSLQLYFTWHVAFYILGVLGFLLLLSSRWQLPTLYKEQRRISMFQLLDWYKSLLTNRLFIGYSLAIGLAWCDYFAFALEAPFLLQKNLGLNSVLFGVVFALVVFGYLIGTHLTKYFCVKSSSDKMILIATFLCLAGSILLIFLISFLPLSWEILALPMVLIMVGVGIIIPCTQGAVMQPFPHIAGTASGLFFFIQMTFGGLCGLMIACFDRDSAAPMALIMLLTSILLVISFYKLVWLYPVTKGK